MTACTHPHSDPGHVMRCYRKHILKCKQRWGSSRGLIHYRRLVDAYLAAKRLVVEHQHNHNNNNVPCGTSP